MRQKEFEITSKWKNHILMLKRKFLSLKENCKKKQEERKKKRKKRGGKWSKIEIPFNIRNKIA